MRWLQFGTASVSVAFMHCNRYTYTLEDLLFCRQSFLLYRSGADTLVSSFPLLQTLIYTLLHYTVISSLSYCTLVFGASCLLTGILPANTRLTELQTTNSFLNRRERERETERQRETERERERERERGP